MYKVEKGIKIPERQMKYPFRLMEVGDSFEFPIEELSRVKSSLNGFKRKSESHMGFTFRDNRCWRIK